MTAKHRNRRAFLKTAAAGAVATLMPRPAISQGAGGRVVVVGGGFAGATCARFHQTHRSSHRGDAGRGEPDLHSLPIQQRRHRRPARSQGTAVRLRQACRRAGHRQFHASRQRRRPGPCGDPHRRRATRLRPPGDGSRHRHPLGRPPGLQRGRRRTHAARLEGGRADAIAAQSARSHARTAARS